MVYAVMLLSYYEIAGAVWLGMSAVFFLMAALVPPLRKTADASVSLPSAKVEGSVVNMVPVLELAT